MESLSCMEKQKAICMLMKVPLTVSYRTIFEYHEDILYPQMILFWQTVDAAPMVVLLRD